jgi:hydrogenase-4 component E
MNALLAQFVNLLGTLLLILAFAMLGQRRILSLVHLFTLQGATRLSENLVAGAEYFSGAWHDSPVLRYGHAA